MWPGVVGGASSRSCRRWRAVDGQRAHSLPANNPRLGVVASRPRRRPVPDATRRGLNPPGSSGGNRLFCLMCVGSAWAWVPARCTNRSRHRNSASAVLQIGLEMCRPTGGVDATRPVSGVTVPAVRPRWSDTSCRSARRNVISQVPPRRESVRPIHRWRDRAGVWCDVSSGVNLSTGGLPPQILKGQPPTSGGKPPLQGLTTELVGWPPRDRGANPPAGTVTPKWGSPG